MPEGSWAYKDLWAPEVHLYKGKYYMFLSLLGKNGLRGTEISFSDSPEGFFIPVCNNPLTPLDKSCIDGTLFVEDGRPYMVYSHDWPDNYIEELGVYIGEIWAIELNEDLNDSVGEPFVLFLSVDSNYSAKAATHDR